MDKTNSSVYGGSFDPPTKGHYHIIQKASLIFNKVYVVLAENRKKKVSSMFTDEERLAMLKDMALEIDPTGEIVKVEVLPEHCYLANFAEKVEAKFLIRGIRDQIDFGYEQQIYRTNRQIQPNVETVYLMPDDAYSLVSSSWVKSLIGCNGWVNIVKTGVTEFVLKELKKKYLKDKFHDVMKSAPFDTYEDGWIRKMWSLIEEAYGKRTYHGFDHLIDCIENLYKYDPTPDPVMLYAIFMHDIDPSEEESARIAQSALGLEWVNSYTYKTKRKRELVERINKLIMATKHDIGTYDTDEEKRIASIDLLILASDPKDYDEYVNKVYDEYFKISGLSKEEFCPIWLKGRIDFLQKMLSRHAYVFSDKVIFYLNETKARENMTRELKQRELELHYWKEFYYAIDGPIE